MATPPAFVACGCLCPKQGGTVVEHLQTTCTALMGSVWDTLTVSPSACHCVRSIPDTRLGAHTVPAMECACAKWLGAYSVPAVKKYV